VSVLSDARELDELRDTVRRFVADRSPLTEVRRVVETAGAYDVEVWSTMAGQLGLPGLAIAEEFGGAGAGGRELAVVAEELGRALLPSPYLATAVLAATAIAASGDPAAAKELLPRIAAGQTTAALAVLSDSGRWDAPGAGVTAVRDGDRYQLDGHATFVLDGHLADVIVVVARTEPGVSLFTVDAGQPGLRRTALPTLDLTRPQARLEFAAVPARLVGTVGQAGPVLDATLDVALVALAADALGGARRCLEMSLAYAKQRVAFGRPIGGFQAVKHKLVDLHLEVEFARTAVARAALAVAADSADRGALASLALAHTVSTYALVATENIHLHGGIGFTWEHDAQLFFKRAKSSQLVLGDAAVHRERVAAVLLRSL
jgi:alkylation response protein AidB-like acyl-CoA dehydrogenase